MEDKKLTPDEIKAQTIKLASARIAARWAYIYLWNMAMLYWYGNPPARPSWVEFSFSCYYGNDVSKWPDLSERDTGPGPDIALIQSCTLALLDGPEVLVRISGNRDKHTYIEDLDTPPEDVNNHKEVTAARCNKFKTGPIDKQCVVYGKCPFKGDLIECKKAAKAAKGEEFEG